MVEVIFQFEVPKEKQEEFIQFVKEGPKPFWESRGCLGYNVWQAAGEDHFMKRMEFPDMPAVEEIVPAGEKDPEGAAIIKKFQSYIKNMSRKPFIKLT